MFHTDSYMLHQGCHIPGGGSNHMVRTVRSVLITALYLAYILHEYTINVFRKMQICLIIVCLDVPVCINF